MTDDCAPLEAGKPPTLSEEEGQWLVRRARAAVEAAARGGSEEPVDPAALPPALREPRGVFVTLTDSGHLRGCIGHLFAREPLWLAVADAARAAAIRDPRFPPVRAEETPRLHIEVSVLTTPRPLAFNSPDDLLARLRPGRDGVVLHLPGGRMATFLPQVWEQIPRKADFLDRLAVKAGGAPGEWRLPETRIEVYEVQFFDEPPKPPQS